jgi:hypothetical protein
MRATAGRTGRFAFFALFSLTALAAGPSLWSQTYPTQIGTEASDRPTGFIDALKNQGRLTVNANGDAVATDASGNPLSDGIVVVFDDRPTPAWAPPIDDPAQYQPDMSGTYTVSFTGQAVLSNVAGNPTLVFSNQSYDAATNTTTVNVQMPGGSTYADGPALMVISFTNTVLNSTSGTNTGIANLQVIRPGFTLAEAANPTQVFDPRFVNAFAPFSYIRFMGWLGTNQNPFVVSGCASAASACSAVNTPTMGWSQRSLPTDFYQGVGPNLTGFPNRAGGWGVSWEYVILLANATNKDVWVNIPINATGSSDQYDPNYVASPDTTSYVYNVAMLLKNGDAFTGNKGLNPGLHIYLEDSNEVWNTGFQQYGWNVNAAKAEVAAAPGGVSVLNIDGDTNSTDWAVRRHIKRVYEIAQIFESVYGAGSFGTIIRPVYAWWQMDEGVGTSTAWQQDAGPGGLSGAAEALAWFKTNYGPPANYFYGMAMGDYFTAANYQNDTTIPEVLADMSANSTASVNYVTANLATANQYGLRLMVYEGGPDNSNGGYQTSENVGPQILANRDPGMDALVQTHIRNNYFEQGGSTFGYFALSGAYSRYGDYGATDDYRNLTTAKYNAIVNLTGYMPNGVPFSPGELVATPGHESVDLAWQPVPGATGYSVYRGLASGAESATAIGTTSSTSYTDASLTDGTTYYYTVSGTNSAGTSAPSNEANATPVAAPSFAISGTAVSVAPGATTGNTSTITLTPSGGFTGSIALTAVIATSPTGAQYLPTLSFGSTTPVSITGSTAGTATLTISTTAATSAALIHPQRFGAPWYAAAGATLAGIFLFCIPARRRSWRRMLGVLLSLAFLAGGLVSCGGGGSSSSNGGGGGGIAGTTAGAYTITITGTSGTTITETATVNLTVQ